MADIAPVVAAVNSSKLDALKTAFSPELASSVTEALANIQSSLGKVQYTVTQSVPGENLLAFTYTASGTNKAGKQVSWTGSGVATLEGSTIIQLRIVEDAIARAIATGDTASLANIAGPSATGTWVGSASGFTVTLKLTQSAAKVTGTATVSGFSGTASVSGDNNYPHNPNLSLEATLSGLETDFSGDFEGKDTVNGKLTIKGFPAIDVTIKRQA